MTDPYEEIIEGETLFRPPPGPRHELICGRLHALVGDSLAQSGVARLLPPRCIVQLTPGTMVRPDLAVIASVTNKIWLIAEVISSEDHRPDTVLKKQIYEDLRIPRLWMVDPRYDNVEIYHGGPYGLALKQILASRERLTETALPDFTVSMVDLFRLEE